VATVVFQHPDEPLVEATDFQDRRERFIVGESPTGELLKKGVDLCRLRRNLSSQQDVAVLIAK
jgi:hypothetical protein